MLKLKMKKINYQILSFSLVFFLISCSKPAGDEIFTVVIPSGAGLSQITKILHSEKVISFPKIFWLRAKLTGKEKDLKAGEYQMQKGMSHDQVLHLLITGEVIRYRVTIPEGLTFVEIAKIFGETNLINEKDFLKLAKDSLFMQELQIPAKTIEGFLFPSTYFISRNQTPRSLIFEMVQNFNEVYTPTLNQRAKEMGFSKLQTVILASIIEKETGQPQERPLISSVFHNRLKKNMKLQTDPTVIYGITNFNGNITKKDLLTPTPYNTYVIRGLPPGPIANPGKEAILASLYPEDTKYLYFVSKNDGSHVFSSTLKDHNLAVDHYQKRIRQTLREKRIK